MADGGCKAIEDIRVGDRMMTFQSAVIRGRGPLMASEVTRIFTNVTREWLVLRPADAAYAGVAPLTLTPGHVCLDEHGCMRWAEDIVASSHTPFSVKSRQVYVCEIA